jgi:hypothetical protein
MVPFYLKVNLSRIMRKVHKNRPVLLPPRTPSATTQMHAMQITAKQKPPTTNNRICSPAYNVHKSNTNLNFIGSRHTQKIRLASALCHELPPKEENMVVFSVEYLLVKLSTRSSNIPLFRQDSNSKLSWRCRHQVFFPHDAQKQRPCR